jgi:hypothetical protein
MERLFSPCTRTYDILESQGRLDAITRYHPEILQELNLNVSTDDFLSAERAFTFTDLYAMLENRRRVLWLTPHPSVVRPGGLTNSSTAFVGGSYCFSVIVDRKKIYAIACSSEGLLEIWDVVLRVLAASLVRSVILSSWRCPGSISIDASSLAYLMGQCQSLRALTLQDFGALDEDEIGVLGAFSRPGLDIALIHCKLTSAGTSALAEVLGRNQGPTGLDYCEMDYLVLANGLRGNSRLKSFIPDFSEDVDVGNRQVLAIADALRENQGLVDLNLNYRYGFNLNDETWGAVCDSLKTHPTLEVLDLNATSIDATTARAVLKSRIQALLDMVKVNVSIHTLHLNIRYRQHELFRKSVIPYLETNRLRPRVRAIQKMRPIPYRAKVLGRALLSARSDANSFWMLLSGNTDVAFPSRTTTIAAATNLPTSATDVGCRSFYCKYCCCRRFCDVCSDDHCDW